MKDCVDLLSLVDVDQMIQETQGAVNYTDETDVRRKGTV